MRRTLGFFLLLGCSPAIAGGFPACVLKSTSGYAEPPTFASLSKCQDKARTRFTRARESKGRPVSDELMERFDSFQRAEMQDYVKRHPGNTSVDEEKREDAKPAARTATDKNLKKIPPEKRDDFQSLKDRLWKSSEDGKRGLNHDMAKDIADFLQKKQGGMSWEMQELLKSLEKDGSTLSDESALRLKKAARQAKSA